MNDRNALLKTLGLDQQAPVRPKPVAVEPESDEEDCVAFGLLRGIRDRALHLQFRLQNGNVESFPYSWLGQVIYNASSGIVLTFVGDKTFRVTLQGRNLAAVVAESIDLLNSGILRHRIVWIREMEREECRRLPEEALTVERITIEAVEKNEGC
jgi:hypothetical protein